MAMSYRGIAKLIEEMGELNQVLGKMLAYGTGSHPDGTDSLVRRFVEEAGDVSAAIRFVADRFEVRRSVDNRSDKKFKQFWEWEEDPNNHNPGLPQYEDTQIAAPYSPPVEQWRDPVLPQDYDSEAEFAKDELFTDPVRGLLRGMDSFRLYLCHDGQKFPFCRIRLSPPAAVEDERKWRDATDDDRGLDARMMVNGGYVYGRILTANSMLTGEGKFNSYSVLEVVDDPAPAPPTTAADGERTHGPIIPLAAGGEMVKDYGDYFLRDDTQIRKGADIEPNEAYSLFRREPYGRVEVFAGPKSWALGASDDVVFAARLHAPPPPAIDWANIDKQWTWAAVTEKCAIVLFDGEPSFHDGYWVPPNGGSFIGFGDTDWVGDHAQSLQSRPVSPAAPDETQTDSCTVEETLNDEGKETEELEDFLNQISIKQSADKSKNDSWVWVIGATRLRSTAYVKLQSGQFVFQTAHSNIKVIQSKSELIECCKFFDIDERNYTLDHNGRTIDPTSPRRTPTREDLKNGPVKCWVRDYEGQTWIERMLIAIEPGNRYPFCADKHGYTSKYRQCEIEAPAQEAK